MSGLTFMCNEHFTLFLRDGVYCGQQYRAAKVMSVFTMIHVNIELKLAQRSDLHKLYAGLPSLKRHE